MIIRINLAAGLIATTLISFFHIGCTEAQRGIHGSQLEKTIEEVHNYTCPIDQSEFRPAGRIGNSIVYKSKSKSGDVKFYLLDENKFSFNNVFRNIKIDAKNTSNFVVCDSLICYTRAFNSNDDAGYSQILCQKGHQVFVLDSVNNSDKKVHLSISQQRKVVIANSLIESKDYYNPIQDNRFVFYYFDNERIGKKIQSCKYCADGNLVEDALFFTVAKEHDVFNEEFSYTDIYKGGLSNPLLDSVKIASFTDIIALSSDGKYVLGERLLDLPNNARAIVDVVNKKYQLLLGRDYSKAKPFFSINKQKFAFDFGGTIVYLNMPTKFPFDALQKNNTEIPNWSDKTFYKKFEHSPLEEN
jgi:hypothetical protein